MANTSILIKRSSTTRTPVTLAAGEFAYSYQSGTLFLGNAAGNGVINVGGLLYTQTIDNATNNATNDTLVKRSANGSASFSTVYGSLGTNSGVTAGSYGSTTSIPVITVAANGIVTGVTTSSISTTLQIAGDTGTDGIALASDTLTLKGGDGITSTVIGANNTTLFDVDGTVIRSSGNQTINGNIQISGNLVVSGQTTTINVNSMNVADPLIYLAANNYSSDAVDIGFVGNYYDGVGQRHAGFFRHAASNTFYAFTGYDKEPDTTVDVNDATFRRASINANLVGGYVAGLANTISVVDGGTGAATFTNGGIVVGSGTGALTTLANSSFTVTGSGGQAKTVTSLTADAYGRITAATYQDISGLTVTQGGTGASSFTSGALLVGDGTSAVKTLANTTFSATGSGATNSTITSVTVDAYGRFTAATYSAISGLTVSQGGTGASSFTTKGIMYGNGTGSMQVTDAAGTADQTWSNQILTTTNAGVPVWSTTLDGGQF